MSVLALVFAVLLSLFILVAFDLLVFSIGKKGSIRAVSVIVLFYLQVVSTILLLGATFILFSLTLVVLNLLISSTVIWLVIRKEGGNIIKSYLRSVQTLFRDFIGAYRKNWLLIILTTLLGMFIFWTFFIGVIFPPLDWDGNDYHLQYTGELIQNRHIWDTPSQRPWITGYPKGGEMIQAWIPIISRNDFLIELTQVPFVLLAIISLYSASRRIGVGRNSALFASVLFAFIPITMRQISTGYIDVMLPALFFAGIALAMQAKYTKLDYILIGFSMSLLIAIKQTAVILAFGIFIIFAIKLHSTFHKKYKDYILPLILASLSVPIGAYWYIKNWIMYQTPIYPFGLKIGEYTVFSGLDLSGWTEHKLNGLPSNTIGQWLYTWSEYGPQNTEYAFSYNYDGSYYGLGPIWFILLLPSILIALYFAVKHRHFIFVKLVALFFVLLSFFPSNYSPRYTIFITGIGIIGIAIALDYIHEFTSKIVRSMAILLAVVTIGTNFQLISASPPLIKAQIQSIANGTGVRGPDTAFSVNLGYAYTFVRNTVKDGDTIAYTDAKWTYPLWNDTFTNRVIYIESNNPSDWSKEIKKESVDFIFLTKNSNAKQSVWADKYFGDKLIYEDEKNAVYEVN